MTVFTPQMPVQVTPANVSTPDFVLTALGDGFAVGWNERDPATGLYQHYVQRFAAAGAPLGSIIDVTGGPIYGANTVQIEGLADGRLVAIWSNYNLNSGSSADHDIFSRVFSAAGLPETSPTLISTVIDFGQQHPSVAALPDSHFVVAWHTDRDLVAPDLNGVNARMFDQAGQANAIEFQINETSQGQQLNPYVTGLRDGGFIAVWTAFNVFTGQPQHLWYRRFDAAGDAVGGEIELAPGNESPGTQYYPSVTGLFDGGFVIAWTGFNTASNSIDAFARRFDSQGRPLGSIIILNQTTAGDQGYVDIAATDAGGFIATWADQIGTGGGPIVARIFDAGGEAVGNEFVVANEAGLPGGQVGSPQIDLLRDGSFVIGAQHATSSGSSYGSASAYVFRAPAAVTLFADASGFGNGANGTGGAGNDQLIGTPLADDIAYGADGDDQIWGRDGADRLFGEGGDDRLFSELGDDILAGGDGADLLAGGDGADDLYGEGQRDAIYGEAGNDRLWGGGGDDRLFAGNDNDFLYGEAGNDFLIGGVGQDILVGGEGDDVLGGGDEADALYAQLGNDILNGGQGIDQFVFASGEGHDIIQDFQSGEDVIVFIDRTFGSFAALQNNLEQSGTSDTLIRIDGFNDILLTDVSIADLSSTDFAFL